MLDANEFMESLKSQPGVQAAYRERGHGIHLEVLRARHRSGMTQEQVAERMGTQKSSISRLESPRAKSLPSMSYLTKFAEATNHRVVVTLEPIT